jgi:hypothetical protein
VDQHESATITSQTVVVMSLDLKLQSDTSKTRAEKIELESGSRKREKRGNCRAFFRYSMLPQCRTVPCLTTFSHISDGDATSCTQAKVENKIHNPNRILGLRAVGPASAQDSMQRSVSPIMCSRTIFMSYLTGISEKLIKAHFTCRGYSKIVQLLYDRRQSQLQ